MSTNKATSENGFMPNTSTISSSRSKFWREFKAEIVKETTLAEASAKYPREFSALPTSARRWSALWLNCCRFSFRDVPM